jgi:hypothetical protein
MAGLIQHLETVTAPLINRLNWITGDAGVFFGFDIADSALNKTIVITHNDTGLVRPAPTGLGTLANEAAQGAGVMPSGVAFYNTQNYNFTITDNTSGSTRTDLLCVFFVEKDLKPYIEPTVVILEGVSSTTDKRYLPIASLSVPNNFLVSKEIAVTRFEYKSMRKAVMTHIANEFLAQNTFNTVLNSEGNLFTETEADFTSAGVLTIDINKEFHTVGNSLTGTRALKNIIVTNTNNVNTTDKFRLFQVQVNLNWCLYNIANIFTDRTYILTPMSVVTFLYDIEIDIFWVVGVTNPRTFKSGSDAVVNASKLIVAPALDELYYVDATIISEIRGISLPLNGVAKSELVNLIGYEFKLAFTNCSHSNTVLISNVAITGSDTICFAESTYIRTPCILNCMVGESGDINFNVESGEVFDDVTALAIASYPSPAIQPSGTDPIKVYKVGINRYLVCGTLETTAAFTSSETPIVITFNSGYKPRLNGVFSSVGKHNTDFDNHTVLIDENSVFVTYSFNNNQPSGSGLRIYFEYIRQ